MHRFLQLKTNKSKDKKSINGARSKRKEIQVTGTQLTTATAARQAMPEATSSKKPKREFDEIFQHVKSFGRYQWFLVACVYVPAFPTSAQFLALVFAFGAPGFHCTTTNVTCPPKKCCDGCTSYAFDGPFHSIVSEWNLICDRAYLAATVQSCFFVGMLLGSFVTGMISDAWGRKKCIFISVAIMATAGISSCFVNNVFVLAALRFFVGFGVIGDTITGYIYCMELAGPTRRTSLGNNIHIPWEMFQMFHLLLSYIIPDWKMYLLAITLPAVLAIPFWWVVPESPRWLIAHDQLDEAHRVLMKYGGKKRKPLDSKLLRTLIEDVRKDQIEREKRAKKYTLIDLFRTPKLRKWTIILSYQWFAVAFVHFGVTLFLTQLAGNIYVNYLILIAMRIIKAPLTWFLLLKFGRRISHGATTIMIGITLLLILAFYKDVPLAGTVLSVLGLILMDFAWTSVYLITTELFPTVLRNTAQGTGSTSARIGAILSPYVAMMGQLPGLSIAFPVTIFGVVALLAGVLMYWLPETLFSPMHQTIEAAESAKDDYSIPCCRRKPEKATEHEMKAPDPDTLI